MRDEYPDHAFTQEMAGFEPMPLFAQWFSEACKSERVAEPNAMALATADENGIPSARMVLLKAVEIDAASFVWYTNLDSAKAREALSGASMRLGGVATAALTWWWPGSGDIPSRQVRVTGAVELVDRVTANNYFLSRPFEARVAATVSRQSKPVAARRDLQQRFLELLARFQDEPGLLKLPDNWGGLRLRANRFEFWQGRTNRLHDRICFVREDDTQQGTVWRRSRLEP